MMFKENMLVGCLMHGQGVISDIITNDEGDVSIVVKFPHTREIYYKDGHMYNHADYNIPHLFPIEKYLRIKAISLE